MNVPLQITYRGVEKSEAIERLIEQRAAGLERFYDNLGGCRVAVEKPHKQDELGSGWRVRIDLHVPPKHEVVVDQSALKGDELSHVVQAAFTTAEKQLQKTVDRIRGEEKTPTAMEVNGYVEKLCEDHGFLRDLSGRDVYFHQNSVLGTPFEALVEGMPVYFHEEQGEKGPQASSLHVVMEEALTKPRRR